MEPMELVMEDLLAPPVRELRPYSRSWLRPLLVGIVVLVLAAVLTQVFAQILKGIGDFFSFQGETSIFAFLVALFGNLYFLSCFIFLIFATWLAYRGAMQRFGTEEGLQGVYWKFGEIYRNLMRAGIEDKARGRKLSREQLIEIVASNKETALHQAAEDATKWAANQTLRAVKEHRDEPNFFSKVGDNPYWAGAWVVALVGLISIPIYVKNGMSILAMLPQEALVMLFGALGGLIIGYVDYLLGAREWVENLLGNCKPTTQSAYFMFALLGVVALFMAAGLYKVEPDKAFTGLAEVRDEHHHQLVRECDANRFKSAEPLCIAARKGVSALFGGKAPLLSIEQESFVDSRTLLPYEVACVNPTHEWMAEDGPRLSQTCYRMAVPMGMGDLAHR